MFWRTIRSFNPLPVGAWDTDAGRVDRAIEAGRRAAAACWTYPDPTARFEAIRDHWAFYAQSLDECWVDDDRVAPNEGDFYGGWITPEVVGPFKGEPGTGHW